MIAIDNASPEDAEKSKPKGRRFQFHLSTAIIILVVAGVLVFLDMRSGFERREGMGVAEIGTVTYGWPVVAYSYEADRYSNLNDNGAMQQKLVEGVIEGNRTDQAHPLDLQSSLRNGDAFVSGETPHAWIARGIALDALAAIAIIAATTVVSEYLICRREGRP